MSSPAHRAALGFLRGGLHRGGVPGPRSRARRSWHRLCRRSAGSCKAAQFLLPVAGFAAGGAHWRRRARPRVARRNGVGCGGGAAGLVLLLTAPHLQGLTGFEDPLVVVPYAIATSAVGVRRDGADWQPGRPARQGRPGCGGLRRWRHRWRPARRPAVPRSALGRPGWADLWVFVTTACSIGSVVGAAHARREQRGAELVLASDGKPAGGGRPERTKAGESALAPPGRVYAPTPEAQPT